MIVMDASVAIKCLVDEEQSVEATGVLAAGQPIIAPDLVLVEIANVLWKKSVRGEIGAEQAFDCLKRAPSFFDRLVAARDLGSLPLRLAQELRHPVYDCTYLALATQFSGIVVSADRRFAASLSATDYAGRVISLQTFSARQASLPKGH